MKHVVITGSSRGLGFALAEQFLKANCHVTISGQNKVNLDQASEKLRQYSNRVHFVLADVRDKQQLEDLWHQAEQHFDHIDIWINNAGINQSNRALWELVDENIDKVIETNLLGSIRGSKLAMSKMLQQGFGQIYNMEGFGSNDMQRKGLNLYGTTKRAITYFTTAMAKEAEGTNVNIGLLSPGMMVTDFITQSEGFSEDGGKTRRIFNILGDKPETVAEFLVPRILANTKNGAHFKWLTNRKAAYRFLTSSFRKRNLFQDT
ncbi:SDR family oxidoreductase [Alicyclobacillus sp. SO9]|uniref:SDR family oxidoreductase n=1 Tax=Alicyclobacillus sp. SO9 TaxID=2665646 RepID=UPI0018E77292|nr:SDR family oxidoreductase [Alicyclobacillus sp. SO9]QQE79057.1 SDR family oxidoreductase [Alicyclobacillus sp. SO9]